MHTKKDKDIMEGIRNDLTARLKNNNVSIHIIETKKRVNTHQYMILFQKANEQLRQKLSFRAFSLYMHLICVCSKENVLHCTIEEMSKSWGFGKRNTYTATKELLDNNVVIHMKLKNGEKYFYINPQVAWKGSLRLWKIAYDNLEQRYECQLLSNVRKINEKSFESLENKLRTA